MSFHVERSVKVTTENHRYQNIDDLCLSLSRINTILGENIFQERWQELRNQLCFTYLDFCNTHVNQP
jgi:hypothetical protein